MVASSWAQAEMNTSVSALTGATQAFVQSLDETQRVTAVFEFGVADRESWKFTPGDRKGIAWNALRDEQQSLAAAVLKAALSSGGYETVDAIRDLEDVLKAMEGSDRRDRGLYYFAVFGEPSTEGTWGLRYEGHHLSLHWTVVKGNVIVTVPQFLGANPAEVPIGPTKGTRALATLEDLARTLLASLEGDQRTAGHDTSTAPSEILTRMESRVTALEDAGVAYRDLQPTQQSMLRSLIGAYTSVQPKKVADARLSRLQASGLDDIKFLWIGGTEKGVGHYYRVQGPTFLIEYDNTQNDANHIHTVWRDFEGDFGRDILLDHYRAHAHTGRPGVHEH
jgi:hypothetical protein